MTIPIRRNVGMCGATAVGLLCNVGMRRYLLDQPEPFQFKD